MSYIFTKWTDELGNTLGSSSTLTMTVTKELTLIANYTLSSIQRTLTILAGSGGSTSPSTGSSIQPDGAIVVVTAYPSTGYQFINWILDGVATSGNPINVLMNRDHVLQPVFGTVSPPPVGEGTLQVKVYKNSVEVGAQVEIVGVGTFTSPFSLDLPVGNYALNVTYQGQTQNKTATLIDGLITATTFNFEEPTPPPIKESWMLPAVGIIALLGGVILGKSGKKGGK